MVAKVGRPHVMASMTVNPKASYKAAQKQPISTVAMSIVIHVQLITLSFAVIFSNLKPTNDLIDKEKALRGMRRDGMINREAFLQARERERERESKVLRGLCLDIMAKVID